MDEFEYEGVFWLADEPIRQAGRLTYKPTEGASLALRVHAVVAGAARQS